MTPGNRREFILAAGAGVAGAWLAPSLAALEPAAVRAKIPLGLIGAGRQGRAILGELATLGGADVVAVCDSDESRLQAALRRAEGARGYGSLAEMLAKEAGLAAVVVATPTHQHREHALAAIAADKHVFCETPLAHTLEDCAALASAARGSKRVLAAGFQGRSNPVYGLARSFFKAGTLRELSHLRAQNHRKNSWRMVGPTPERDRELNWHLDPKLSLGLLGELGAHQFDVFHWFLGRHPISVRARGSLRLHRDGREIPDCVSAQFVFEDGLELDYSCSLVNSFEGRHEVFTGAMAAIKLAWTHGWMFKESDAPTQGWEVYANRQQFHNEQGITLIADATKLASQGKLQEGVGLPYNSLYYALSDFLVSIDAAKAPACSFSDAARSTSVGILAHRALTSGAEVAIDPKQLEDL